jgi:hypothetical protein
MEIDAPQEPVARLEEKDSKQFDEKTVQPIVNGTEDSDAASIEHGHLQELEVDLDLVIQEQGEEDYAADHSPFPEGTFSSFFTDKSCVHRDDQFELLSLMSTTKQYQSTPSECGFLVLCLQWLAVVSISSSVCGTLQLRLSL